MVKASFFYITPSDFDVLIPEQEQSRELKLSQQTILIDIYACTKF
jgi:hypothetical protein